MRQQRRCLLGMTNGLPVDVPLTPADPVVLHTFDTGSSQDANGRPALDVVALYIQNSDTDVEAGPANVTLSISGVPLVVQISPGTIVQVLDETSFGGTLSAASGGGGQITAECDTDTVVAWGWFVRTEG